ncbi:MAG: hypothetical protein IMZ65_01455 [Planctomycetes bacterium]|nr:hypothetical protein [Planctomycetota bacterium]
MNRAAALLFDHHPVILYVPRPAWGGAGAGRTDVPLAMDRTLPPMVT